METSLLTTISGCLVGYAVADGEWLLKFESIMVRSRVLVTIYPSAWCNNRDGLNFQQHGSDNLKSRAVALIGRYLMPKVIIVLMTCQEIGYNVLRDIVSLMVSIFEVILMVVSVHMWSSVMLLCVMWWLGGTAMEELNLRTVEQPLYPEQITQKIEAAGFAEVWVPVHRTRRHNVPAYRDFSKSDFN
jgi:hypothetical protein